MAPDPAPVVVPGDRPVRGSLDGGEHAACVVACPPHPQHGGTRRDARMRAIAAALGERRFACLRFDYGPWDGGRGERSDAARAVEWARDRFDPVGLVGYSFGGAIALLAAPSADVGAVGALAPPSRLDDLETAPALDEIRVPVRVFYGRRDDTVDWTPVVERARSNGQDTVAIDADHFFVSREDAVAARIASFFADRLG